MDRHVENARKVAEFLAVHPKVAGSPMPGSRTAPTTAGAEIPAERRRRGVHLWRQGGFEAGIKLVEGVRLFSHLANIGDTRSLILHPASTTHRQLTDEQRLAAGAGPDVVRLSVGLETADDFDPRPRRGVGGLIPAVIARSAATKQSPSALALYGGRLPRRATRSSNDATRQRTLTSSTSKISVAWAGSRRWHRWRRRRGSAG